MSEATSCKKPEQGCKYFNHRLLKLSSLVKSDV